VVSTQVPAQPVWPVGQQTFPVQVWPAAQHAEPQVSPAVQRHAPAMHACAAGQALAQRPQWAVLVVRVVSQPLAATPSQSPSPVGHMTAKPHAPDRHTLMAPTGGTGQRLPHAPQLLGSPMEAMSSVSQPSVVLPLQSP
jgi:hypothetical protein